MDSVLLRKAFSFPSFTLRDSPEKSESLPLDICEIQG